MEWRALESVISCSRAAGDTDSAMVELLDIQKLDSLPLLVTNPKPSAERT